MRALKSAFLSVAMFCALTACTSYGEMGFTGGYESNWLAPDVLSVEARGNAFTSDRRVRDYAMLQAAERAAAAGYRYFTIIENENQGRVETYWSPPTTTTTGTVTGNTFSARSTTSGGPDSYYKPGRALVVRMYREPPIGYVPGQYYEVDELLHTLGQRYLRRAPATQPTPPAPAAQ